MREQNKLPGDATNPNHVVPTIDDDDLRLTESSAILDGQPMLAP